MKALLVALFGLMSICLTVQAYAQESELELDIEQIRPLEKGMKPGTIAYVLVDQLHPTQPQTGKREVERKIKNLKSKLKSNGQKFSKDFFKEMIDQMAPVYLAKTPQGDSRVGKYDFLAYLTDRHHGADAMSQLYKELYGKQGRHEVFVDDKGRALNVMLVRVVEDKTDLNEKEFSEFMVKNNRGFFEIWSEGSKGETRIDVLKFNQLPTHIWDTTDNPYRSVIGDLQKQKHLEKLNFEFSQFYLAKELVQAEVLQWQDISLSASDQDYEAGLEKAQIFFDENKDEIIDRLKKKYEKPNPSGTQVCEKIFRTSGL